MNTNTNSTTRFIYRYERKRLGHKRVSEGGERYGPYLYRNLETNRLLSSWDKPDAANERNGLYKGEDIGMLSDAIFYYKNE